MKVPPSRKIFKVDLYKEFAIYGIKVQRVHICARLFGMWKLMIKPKNFAVVVVEHYPILHKVQNMNSNSSYEKFIFSVRCHHDV